MANYNDLKSSGNYDYSKGPKSIYYAKGDENLPAVVLNVPQIDDDDEWGGTSRIAHEKAIDYIGELWLSVKDPLGNGSGLESEMGALIGEAGIIKDLFKDDVEPSVVLGNVTVSGQDDKISIGSQTELTGDHLTMGSTSVTDNTDYSEIKFKQDTSIRFTENSENKHIEFTVNGQVYRFTSDGLFLPGDAALSIGNLSTDEINAQKVHASLEVTTPRIYNRGGGLDAGINMVVYCAQKIKLGTGQFNEQGEIDIGTTVMQVTYDYVELLGDMISDGGTIGTKRKPFGSIYSDTVETKLIQAYDPPSEINADPVPTTLELKANDIRITGHSSWDIEPKQIVDFNNDRMETRVDILPTNTGTQDIGSENLEFLNVYTKTMRADTVVAPRLKEIKLIQAYEWVEQTTSNITLDIKGKNVRFFSERGDDTMVEVMDITGDQINIRESIVPVLGNINIGSTESYLHSVYSQYGVHDTVFINDTETGGSVAVKVKDGQLEVGGQAVAYQ